MTLHMLDSLRRRFTFPDDQTDSLLRLAAVEPTPDAFTLPDAGGAHALLTLLGVSPDAIDDAVAALPGRERDPEAWWLLERMFQEFRALDGRAGPLWWPYPEPAEDALARFLQLYVFLAAIPHARAMHAERGIPDDIALATLSDVALSIEWYRRRTGRPGFNSAFWMSQHFKCAIFLLGRLQFNFTHVVFDPPDGATFARDDQCLGVHIPALGPMTVAACDESFARARAFFPRHFPERRDAVATCGSWLLDPQLADYLPEDSNIIRFQRRFTPAPGWEMPGDDDVIRFVFGYIPDDLGELPQRTTMERAAVSHIRSGREWKIRHGWVVL